MQALMRSSVSLWAKKKGPVYGPRSLEEEVRQTTRLTLPTGYDIRPDAGLETFHRVKSSKS